MLSRSFWSVLTVSFVLAAPALGVADTSWVKVIFYDYRANGTNPNFEKCNTASLVRNLVRPTLGPDRKPLLNRSANCASWDITCPLSSCHNRLDEWFRPSTTNGPDNAAQFLYDSLKREWRWTGLVNYQNKPHEWVSPRFNASDPMANIIIYDSLPFVTTTVPGSPRGTLEFSSDAFFKLNGRGFGADFTRTPRPDHVSPNNNYGFAMELHIEFTYVGGEFFSFTGDDDVFAFIDGKLVMDLGGTHGPESGSFRMDSLAAIYGFQKGKKYSFDFFYCERHTWGSNIKISTNLIKPPSFIRLNTSDGGTLPAGSSTAISGQVFNSDGVLDTTYTKLLTWSVVTPTDKGDVLTSSSGPTTTLAATKAYRTIRVRALVSYTDPVSGTTFPVEEYIDIRVVPGPAANIWFEQLQGDSVRDLNTPQPQERYYIPLSTTTEQATAVLRDRFGNFVGLPPSPPTWTSKDAQKIMLEPSPGVHHRATITKGISPGVFTDSVRIIVSQGELTPDTAWVVADYLSPPIAISQARLYLGAPPGTLVSAPRDTLLLTFSKPVSCDDLTTPSAVFGYMGQDSARFAASATFEFTRIGCSGTGTQALILVDTGIIIPLLDSIRITRLRDSYGTETIDGQPRVIEWGRNYDPVIRVTANPYTPSTGRITLEIDQSIDRGRIPTGAPNVPTHALGIRVETASFQNISIENSSVIIYDMVGNKLTDKLPAYPTINGKFFYFFWNGRNTNGRTVGSGTYLGVVTIQKTDGTPSSVSKVKIGIKN